ncbi:MAG: HalOD1 output domain-containing protein [Haloarcula sp.]
MMREVHSAESVSEAVVQAVSTAEGCPPRALPSLYDVVNPEALNDLFHDEADPGSQGKRVSFQFSDSTVTVEGGGSITVEQSQRPGNRR